MRYHISTLRTSFPHQKIRGTLLLSSRSRVSSNQRERDLPEGESRQGAAGRTGNGTLEAFGKPDANGQIRESSYNAVIEEKSGKRGFTPVGPEPVRSDKALWSGSRTRPSKNRKKGRDPAREIAPSLLFRSVSPTRAGNLEDSICPQ